MQRLYAPFQYSTETNCMQQCALVGNYYKQPHRSTPLSLYIFIHILRYVFEALFNMECYSYFHIWENHFFNCFPFFVENTCVVSIVSVNFIWSHHFTLFIWIGIGFRVMLGGGSENLMLCSYTDKKSLELKLHFENYEDTLSCCEDHLNCYMELVSIS